MTDTYEQDMDEYRHEKYIRSREHAGQEPVLPECIPELIDLIQAQSGGVMLPETRAVLTAKLHTIVTLAPSAKGAIEDVLRWATDSR